MSEVMHTQNEMCTVLCVYSRAEFKECMATLGMTFSQKKWDKIFHEIDLNFDNEVGCPSLFISSSEEVLVASFICIRAFMHTA